MQPMLETTIAIKCPQIASGSSTVGSGLSHCEVHSNDRPLVTFQRCESDVKCFDATTQDASWSKVCDFVGRLSTKSSSKCPLSTTSFSNTRRHIGVVVPHTGARNSRNRVRMSSTGEDTSKYSADDPRGARAVWKLGVGGPELNDASAVHPLTTCATSLASALRTPIAIVRGLTSAHGETFNVTLRSVLLRSLISFPVLRIGDLTCVTRNSAPTL